MKVSYLSSSCVPSRTANSIHVMKMCQAFACAGQDVVLFANKNRDPVSDFKGDVFEYYGVTENFRVEYAYWPAMPFAGFLFGINIAIKALSWQPDIVYGRNLAACYYCATKGVPTALELHTAIEERRPEISLMLSRFLRAPKFRYLTVITYALRDHYLRKWPHLEGRIVVAPDGADVLDAMQRSKALTAEKSRLQIGYTGHLYPGKGAELIVALARMCPEYDFHIVGGTDSDLKRWMVRSDLPDNMQLHGHRPHHEIHGYLLGFDVLLLPNQPVVYSSSNGSGDIGRWTSPLKLFEYMAAKRPIICSNVEVIQEVAKDEVNMLVCPWDEPEKWVRAIKRLEADRELSNRLARNAWQELVAKYSWDARARFLLKLM